MPPQKNSNKRGSRLAAGALKKCNRFFDDYLSDLRTDGKVDDMYVGRIIADFGNRLMNVFYCTETGARIDKCCIRGLYRGKAKKTVTFEANTIVLIADTHVPGPSQFKIMALLSSDQVSELRKVKEIDSRVLNLEVSDTAELMKDESIVIGGFDFMGGATSNDLDEDDDDDDEVDVDAI
jgi:hypothetical protein